MEINMEIKIANGILMESGLPFLGVERFEFEWKPNEHAFLTMRGYLNEKEKYHLAEAYGDKIKLKLEEGGVTLFYGYLVDIRVDHVGNTREIKLKAASGSFRIDRKLESESFQNQEESYAEIAQKTAKGAGARVICTEGIGISIGKPVIRYQETAWQFIKRLASGLGTCIVSDIMTGERDFWFGMRNGESIPSLAGEEYTVDICRERDGGKVTTIYKVKSRKFYKIGDRTTLNGVEWKVCGVKAVFQKGELTFRYLLKQEEIIKPIYLDCFTGLGLKGTIAEVKNEQVRIVLDIDEGRETGQYFYNWYPETGNSLYAMPEPGTRAVLCFGEREEREGFAMHSLPNTMKEFRYYRNRQLDTKEGNMLHLNEQSIAISKEGSRSVCICNGLISANSVGKFRICAENEVRMSAKRIILRSPDEVNICQE